MKLIPASRTEFRNLSASSSPTTRTPQAFGPRSPMLPYPSNGVWTMNADGSNRKVLDLEGWSAQWSPDGNMIAYTVGGNLKVYNRKSEKTFFVFPLQNSPYSYIYWNPCWSPDSKSICFKGKAKTKYYEIVTVNAKEGAQGFKVHFSDPKQKPSEDKSWNPNGKQILFTMLSKEHKKRRIFSLDPTKEKATPTLLPGQTYKENVSDVCWAPDGKQLVFVVR